MNAPEQARLRMTVPMEVGICCADLDGMLAFYTGVLGLALVNRVSVPADKAAATGLTSAGYDVARLQTSYGERVKLLQPAVAPQPRPAAGAILDRQGATYLTFIVRDLPGVVRQLQARGVTFDSAPAPMEVRPGTWLAFFRDPEGNVLELVEYDDPPPTDPTSSPTRPPPLNRTSTWHTSSSFPPWPPTPRAAICPVAQAGRRHGRRRRRAGRNRDREGHRRDQRRTRRRARPHRRRRRRLVGAGEHRAGRAAGRRRGRLRHRARAGRTGRGPGRSAGRPGTGCRNPASSSCAAAATCAPATAAAPAQAVPASGGGRRLSSPLARRLAAQWGVDLARVAGSGPHGRILRRDVEAARDAAPAAGQPQAAAPRAAGRRVPHSGMRHRPPPERKQADRAALLPDGGLPHGRAAGAARAGQPGRRHQAVGQ